MSNKLGRFEILSELAHSGNIVIYKATDSEGGQTIALKVLDLGPLGEQAAALVKAVSQEAETCKVLNSHNIASLNSTEEIEGKLCASLEYVQGNSIATMLARKEGFSIWDLQDIARQTCQGLDHAHNRNVFHYTLEPAKIMVTWDGTVKVLGFGTSTMSAFAAQAQGKVPEVLSYMPPEQLRGDPLDARSNIFSLGSILYEMVTEHKAFPGEDAGQVRQQILEATPVPPDQINKKVNPALSALILKALAKAPEERYQSGQELVNDLEHCKDAPAKAAAPAKPAQLPRGLNVSGKAAPVSKPAPQVAAPPKPPEPVKVAMPKPVVPEVPPPVSTTAPTAVPAVSSTEATGSRTPVAAVARVEESTAPAAKAAVASAGTGSANADAPTPSEVKVEPTVKAEQTSCVRPIVGDLVSQTPQLSAAPIIEPEVHAPKITVDPTMIEGEKDSGGGGHKSFSEIDELPPLKEVYSAPAPPPPPAATEEPALQPTLNVKARAPEKPKIQPREVARKAVTEIKKTPPKLFVYSIAAALGIILLIVVGIAFHIHSENSEEEGTPVQSAAPVEPAPPVPQQPTDQTPALTTEQAGNTTTPPTDAPSHEVSVTPKYSRKKVEKPAAAPVIVPGQLNVNSTPEGALISLDGRTDPAWTTPYNLTGLEPGQHSITISKAGYSPEARTIEVGAGSKSFLVVQLASMTAAVSVTSQPVGADILIDGKETGKATPAQISVDRPGNHTLLVRKRGYLEESTTANLQLGQVFQYAPTLKALGSTDDIKFKKMFGRGDTTGMGSVSVKTQPKGAQIAVNRRVIDRNTPTEFFLNPGTYVVDITATGFKGLHKVINVEKGSKVAIEESMERE